MRVFIAIDIGQKVKKAMGNLLRQLQGVADGSAAGIKKGDVKWVRPENMHLTLKFLGEIKDDKIAEVCNIVENVAGRHKSFELNVESVGYFGGKIARVLWVGIGPGGDKLRQLAEELELELASAGWPEETREFSGHLTLCRIKGSVAGAKLARISEDYKDFKVGVVSADSVSVYQSQLMPAGPIYTVLGNYKLS